MDPCLARLVSSVFEVCTHQHLDAQACCSALHAPTGCSAEWAATFATYSHRFRVRMQSSGAPPCAASWPCLFNSNDRNAPCFSATCSGLFSAEGDLTPACSAHISDFCSGGTAPAAECLAFADLASPEKCGASSIEWRHCAAHKSGHTIVDSATTKLLHVHKTVSTRLTVAEYTYWKLKRCETGHHRPRCPPVSRFIYDPARNATHPFFNRAAPFTVFPPFLPYATPETEAIAAVAVVLLVLLHFLDVCVFWTRSARFLDV